MVVYLVILFEKCGNPLLRQHLLKMTVNPLQQEQEAGALIDEMVRNDADHLRSSEMPQSWENVDAYSMHPYGNTDYNCSICFQELTNTYFHCNGCEELLQKELNISCCTIIHIIVQQEQHLFGLLQYIKATRILPNE